MAYQQGGKIEATDYNVLAGNLNEALADIGQPALPTNLARGGKVLASQWSSLISNVASVANHQGTGFTTITDPTTSSKASFNSALSTNITNVRAGRKNARLQGTDAVTVTTNGSRWIDRATFNHTVTFGSVAAAQYFFNGGGQVLLTFAHPGGSAIDNLFNALATASGAIVLSSPSSGTVSIASSTFTGITKSGGSGSPTTLLSNAGYYGLTGTNQEVYKQYGTSLAGFGGVNYSQSYISVNMNVSSGGATINITTVWDEYPNGLLTGAGTTVRCIIRPPSTLYFQTASWGTVTVTGSVAAPPLTQ